MYYNPNHPASYGGFTQLYKQAKKDGKNITIRQVKEWLKGQDTYTLHKQIKRKFKRNRVFSPKIDHQWDADLMDMTQISEYNDGYKYVLLAIDIFSRYVWTVPLKTKQAAEVVKAFQTILEKDGRKPRYLRTDKGGEFTSFKASAFFKRHNIQHFVTQNEEIKANYAERAIKTIKMKLYKYFTFKQTYRYVDQLDMFTRSYNHRIHSTIQIAPVNVNKDNEDQVFSTQYLGVKSTKKRKYGLKVGDFVRISHKKKPFTREYHEKWSGELFQIIERFKREGIPIYKIQDYAKEPITGTFYELELQAVTPGDVFKIEKVLKTRKRKGHPKEYFVRWLRWPPKYDSWVNENDLAKL